MTNNVLEQTSMESPLLACSTLKPKGGRYLNALAATLMLTSLVDAFSILVVYLLMSYSSSGEILFISKDMVLPTASMAEDLDRQVIVKYEKGKYYVEDEELELKDLFSKLLGMRKEFQKKYPELEFENKIIIQADRNVEYGHLNTVIHAGAQAGYEEIKFAVMMGGVSS